MVVKKAILKSVFITYLAKDVSFFTQFPIENLWRRVDFPDLVVDNRCAIDPWIAIFTEQSVAAHDVSFDESMLADGKQHVIRAGWFVVASGAIDS
jgi:hypothetical protein